MKILVIGSVGRENALVWKLNQSEQVEKIYCVPGNGGTELICDNVAVDVRNHVEVVNFCKEKIIDLVVIGPEAPLASGLADDLEKEGINVFGASYAASRLESSKIYAKEVMGRYNIPTAEFRIFQEANKAIQYIETVKLPVVIKANGLAQGKGVIIAETKEEAIKTINDMLCDKIFGSAGDKIIIEECLFGEEASILVLTDGENILPLASSQDHKRIFEGDKGPNTGGMGAYSPAPVVDGTLFDEIVENVVRPTIEGLKKDGVIYKGVLYAGIMITEDGPKVLEYNVRFGDPETQVILPRMKCDLADILMSVAKGDLSGKNIDWDERDCVCVVMASGGYPGSYEKGRVISGIADADELDDVVVFHAGTKAHAGNIVTNGGRVLGVTALGDDVQGAISKAYEAVGKISWDGVHYRKDIGKKAL